MKILQVVTRREFRGAEVVATSLSEGFETLGHETALVGLFTPPNLEEADHLTSTLNDVHDLNGRRTLLPNLTLSKKLQRVIDEFQPDVIQANAFNALKFCSLIKWWRRASWPIVYRNVGIASRWITRPGQRQWGRWLMRQASHVVSVSDASRDDFAETYRFSKEKISVIRRGVDVPDEATRTAMRSRLIEAAEIPHDSEILVHVGKFSPEKNHVGLLEAFSTIRCTRMKAKLVLFGDGPLRGEIESVVESNGLREHVRLLGSNPNAGKLVAGADLMLMCSHVEGIPGVILEAFAGRVPVVATDVGGIPEIVQHEKTGVLVPAGDMQQLASAAERILGDDDLRLRYGNAGLSLVAQDHDMRRSVAHYLRLYSRLTGCDDGLPATADTTGPILVSTSQQ